jgi:hypothetical protein
VLGADVEDRPEALAVEAPVLDELVLWVGDPTPVDATTPDADVVVVDDDDVVDEETDSVDVLELPVLLASPLYVAAMVIEDSADEGV